MEAPRVLNPRFGGDDSSGVLFASQGAQCFAALLGHSIKLTAAHRLRSLIRSLTGQGAPENITIRKSQQWYFRTTSRSPKSGALSFPTSHAPRNYSCEGTVAGPFGPRLFDFKYAAKCRSRFRGEPIDNPIRRAYDSTAFHFLKAERRPIPLCVLCTCHLAPRS